MTDQKAIRPEINTLELLTTLKKIDSSIVTDFGGGSPISKTFVMAKLALELGLRKYVEIGIYRGKSFFQLAKAIERIGGYAVGIDPYEKKYLCEEDLVDDLKEPFEVFLNNVDLQKIYEEVNELGLSLGLAGKFEIIRKPSWDAILDLRAKRIQIDMLHIDGNHDTTIVLRDLDLYFPLVSDGGIIVLDDVNWPSVTPAFKELDRKSVQIFNNGFFAIFYKKAKTETEEDLLVKRVNKDYSLINRLIQNDCQVTTTRPIDQIKTVSIILLSYNQEQFVAECIEGILSQRGDFIIELIIGDDASTDKTLTNINGYLQSIKRDPGIRIVNIDDQTHVGMTANLKRCFNACTGDYIAICEGDDYWVDTFKIQKQIDFLHSHPDCSMCFNDIYIQNGSNIYPFEVHQNLQQISLSTRDIIRDYVIGNISACFYSAKYRTLIPDSLFDLYIGDWMFNIYFSLFGRLGHLREIMSVYRKHDQGAWTGKSDIDRHKDLINYIAEYNQYLNYEYDPEFQSVVERLDRGLANLVKEQNKNLISIIDDIFPNPLSAFRYQEFLSYLKSIENIEILCSGISYGVLGNTTLDDCIIDFKKRFPQFSTKVKKYKGEINPKTSLIYTVFLGNTYVNIEKIDELGIPFVFTLYPGGLFGIDNEKSDWMLRRVTSSPNFRKVLVTQRITKDYLLEKNFCSPDQIEFIYGVVTPLEYIDRVYEKKCRFGDKENLDICFVAHKYTDGGIDKGFDVFIAAALALLKQNINVSFHIVGGFSRFDADLQGQEKHFTFYGSRNIEWMDEFYRDKDIIISPNIPNMIYPGSFDGFPTGTCTDAGLREVAIFCTDPLGLNISFVDGKDIVIIKHNVDDIVEKVEYYYANPKELRDLAKNGSERIKALYNYTNQIQPRIELLNKQYVLSLSDQVNMIDKKLKSNSSSKRIKLSITNFLIRVKKRIPKPVRTKLVGLIQGLRSNESLKNLILRIVPFRVIQYLKFISKS